MKRSSHNYTSSHQIPLTLSDNYRELLYTSFMLANDKKSSCLHMFGMKVNVPHLACKVLITFLLLTLIFKIFFVVLLIVIKCVDILRLPLDIILEIHNKIIYHIINEAFIEVFYNLKQILCFIRLVDCEHRPSFWQFMGLLALNFFSVLRIGINFVKNLFS
ncbi:MAG: hypothetical protein MHMPM18_001520 [Marteilia pararefringens]